MFLTRVLFAGVVTTAALGLAGCPSSAGVNLGDMLVLGVGDSTTIPDLNLYLRFAQIADDSRCPLQTSCPSVGDAAVVLEIMPYLSELRVDTLHTNLDPKTTLVGHVEVQLVRLDPYPTAAGPIALRDYRLTLITREIPLDSTAGTN